MFHRRKQRNMLLHPLLMLHPPPCQTPNYKRYHCQRSLRNTRIPRICLARPKPSAFRFQDTIKTRQRRAEDEITNLRIAQLSKIQHILKLFLDRIRFIATRPPPKILLRLPDPIRRRSPNPHRQMRRHLCNRRRRAKRSAGTISRLDAPEVGPDGDERHDASQSRGHEQHAGGPDGRLFGPCVSARDDYVARCEETVEGERLRVGCVGREDEACDARD